MKKVRGLRECSALRELQAPQACVCVCVCVCEHTGGPCLEACVHVLAV